MKKLALLAVIVLSSYASSFAQSERTVNAIDIPNRTLNGFRFSTGIVIK